jgi:hypothetical protein
MVRSSFAGGLACALIAASLGGCASFDAPASKAPAGATSAPVKTGEITAAELDQLTNAFADNYIAQLASACDEVKLKSTDPRIIADAGSLKLISATSVFDIVTGVDPFGQMLDLFMMISLQHIVWVEEGGAARRLGPASDSVVNTIRQARTEVLELAERTMKPEQVQLLIEQARDWRAKNPNIAYVGFVRFNDAASARALAVADDVRKGGGLLSPVSNVVDSLERSRKIAERGLYLAKRMPMLLGWQADDVVSGVMSRSDVRAALESLHHLSDALERNQAQLARVADLVPTERQAIIEELHKQQAAIDQTLARVDSAIASGTALLERAQQTTTAVSGIVDQTTKASASLQQSLSEADKLLARLETTGIITRDAEGRGRGLEGLNATADKLATAARELNQLTQSSNALLASPDLTKRLAELDTIADQRMAQAQRGGERLAHTVFKLVAGIIGLALLAGLIYQTYTFVLRRREHRRAGAA